MATYVACVACKFLMHRGRTLTVWCDRKEHPAEQHQCTRCGTEVVVVDTSCERHREVPDESMFAVDDPQRFIADLLQRARAKLGEDAVLWCERGLDVTLSSLGQQEEVIRALDADLEDARVKLGYRPSVVFSTPVKVPHAE